MDKPARAWRFESSPAHIMPTQYFIGIVPPVEIQNRIQEFQRQNRRNLFPKRVEPHITVKAPGGLAVDESWLPAVRKAVGDLQGFDISFGGIGYFGDRVLFIEAKAPELQELNEALVKATNTPIEILAEFKEDKYHGHLTLGLRDKKFPDSDLLLAGERAKRELANLPPFRADFVRVFKKIDFGAWEKMEDIPFGK